MPKLAPGGAEYPGRWKTQQHEAWSDGRGSWNSLSQGRFQGRNRDGLLEPQRMGLWEDPSLQDNGLKKSQARRPAAATENSGPRECIPPITIARGFPQKKRKGIHREP